MWQDFSLVSLIKEETILLKRYIKRVRCVCVGKEERGKSNKGWKLRKPLMPFGTIRILILQSGYLHLALRWGEPEKVDLQ